MKGIGDFGMVYGAFCGLLLSQWFTPGIISGETVRDLWYKKGARLAIAIALSYIWMGVQKLVSKAGFTDPYIVLFAKQFVPFALIGLSTFYFADLISSRVGLFEMMNKQDDNGEKDEEKNINVSDKEANEGVIEFFAPNEDEEERE